MKGRAVTMGTATLRTWLVEERIEIQRNSLNLQRPMLVGTGKSR
jgi:hypothetical protein